MINSRMPALFLGHGSPMNVLENNRYTQVWQQMGSVLPRPKAIVMISAHWLTRTTCITAMSNPATIHDFNGFPQALYDIHYPAPGSPGLAKQIAQLLLPFPVYQDDASWGLDHGAWGVLIKMYPQADIPVVQLSVDSTKPVLWHFEIGRKLSQLRGQGVMLIASGNVVHNLRMLNWDNEGDTHLWANSFNQFVKDNLQWQGIATEHPLVNYLQHKDASLANPTPEHFLPLLYILGAWDQQEAITIPVEGMEMRSLSMLSVQVG